MATGGGVDGNVGGIQVGGQEVGWGVGQELGG